MLKVLWLTNFVMPEHAVAIGLASSPRGGWMPALAEALVDCGQVTLGVATNVPGASWRQDDINGIRYYTMPCPKRSIQGGHLPDTLIRAYQRVAEEFCPDVIHVQGTEYFQGLLTGRGHLKYPTVISIQGILDVCQRHYFGGMTLSEILKTRTLRDWIHKDGLIEQKNKWIKRSKWEREVFATNSAFIGQTLWDHAHMRRLNPNGTYYHHDRLLRKPFYSENWDINTINRYSIFASSASYPLKGFHVLVKAVALLRCEFPDITVQTPLANFFPRCSGVERFWKNCRSGGYSRYLTDLIRSKNLESRIEPLPSLDAKNMAGQFLKSHVFVMPSFIENESISLAEAMLVGTPAVASFVGGVPSMVQDGDSALLFPPGDEAVLAEQIRRVFLDDDLACGLSARAKRVAQARHSQETIVRDMIEIYGQVAKTATTTVSI